MSTTLADFNFSDEPITFGPFNIGKSSYILQEASEDAYTAYRNMSMRALKLLDTGSTISEGGHEADALLTQRCLFEVVNGNYLPVKPDFVRGLPRRITKPLYTKIREISGMDAEEETIEFLTKRIEKDTKKLEGLKAGKETEAKNV